MQLVYLGTPEMAVPPLRALHAAGHEIVLVVSGPDKRRGRGRSTSPSPVKAAAIDLGLSVTDDPADVLSVTADLGVVVAYGQILRAELLEHLQFVNLHFSLLPRWRGAAPVERAILAGDDRTGVCVMAVEAGLDTGAVYARREVPISDTTTTAQLGSQLVEEGTRLLVDTLEQGLGEPVEQPDEGVTYAAKLHPADRELHWDRPAPELHRVVRVGGAWTTFRGSRLKVLDAEPLAEAPDSGGPPGSFVGATEVRCGTGVLRLLRVQPEGKAAMDAVAWANGAQPGDSDRLGT